MALTGRIKAAFNAGYITESKTTRSSVMTGAVTDLKSNDDFHMVSTPTPEIEMESI